ncbi:MAG: glycerate kinase [Verrucomicrobiales bacterium]|jgi:glycerate kinase
MRILIAPDKFKGSLTAVEVAETIARGLGDFASSCSLLPIADGGEGMTEAVRAALGGETVRTNARDPLMRTVEADYAVVENGATAVMEMSAASGLWRLSENERDPIRATTFGTGEMILDAARRGVSRIILGIGGSATNDGGSGLALALGYRFFDSNGAEIRDLPAKLTEIARIDPKNAVKLPEIITACDVDNPLLGEHGATRVYGPQKGIAESDFELHEQRLGHLADLAQRDLGIDPRTEPGSGAAGGLGFGTIAFCKAKLQPGFDLIADLLDLETQIAASDLVITGEGSLDAQTLNGKGPHGVAMLARNLGKPVVAFAGITDGSPRLFEAFDRIEVIRPEGVSIEESISRGQQLLEAAASRLTTWIRAEF